MLVGLQQYPANGAIESLCGVAALFTAVKSGDHGNPHTLQIENWPRATQHGASFLWLSKIELQLARARSLKYPSGDQANQDEREQAEQLDRQYICLALGCWVEPNVLF